LRTLNDSKSNIAYCKRGRGRRSLVRIRGLSGLKIWDPHISEWNAYSLYMIYDRINH